VLGASNDQSGKEITTSCRHLLVVVALSLLARVSPGQTTPAADPAAVDPAPTNTNAVPHSDKHIFGIIPNFRTSPELAHYEPISAREKFRIASQDSFDRGTFLLAAAFAGVDMLNNSNPSFGHGVEGYSKYLGSSYADFVIGNFMTEGIFPTILHQDPRYFRRGRGSGMSRLGYAMGQIFWTHQDSGHTNFNFSEVVGNSAAVAISTTYYKDDRSAGKAAESLGVQLAVDTASNILKEFWPDIDRKFRPKHSKEADSAGKP
jgi:hypothetical protein